ncbi:hypothetical protein Mycch_2575 [Mycolicibacterium chubuense NBB4]|uniref:DUF4333 domain-containing protein n=1 Tax=Mycolicibacterium chubuense (strain NBB4) TaxID=710421 RepID=I4BJ90_MYCCN|nr:DUF4333 domain-containing protein [Mycolicibacterium chubuense]AFM17347.1 hypothetical protein Mycch_2575 [Mycolicibacterium chubuense NBB4]
MRPLLGLVVVSAAVAACQFSASVGGPDYAKLEKGIADELNNSYKEISRQVSGVACPKPSELKSGDTLICKADVDGNTVRVLATATDDEGNVDFKTLDTVFDLERTAGSLAGDISRDRGFDVTVDCGSGLKVVEIGQSFECTAADPQGNTRTVKLTAGAPGENDRWEIVGA